MRTKCNRLRPPPVPVEAPVVQPGQLTRTGLDNGMTPSTQIEVPLHRPASSPRYRSHSRRREIHRSTGHGLARGRRERLLAYALAALLITALAVGSLFQVRTWRTDLSVWTHAVALDMVYSAGRHIKQQVYQVIRQQIDFVNIQNTTISPGQ